MCMCILVISNEQGIVNLEHAEPIKTKLIEDKQALTIYILKPVDRP